MALPLFVSGPAYAAPADAGNRSAAGCPAALSFQASRLQDEATQDLCQFTGKVVLVVNTASQCGFTPQYEGLMALHTRYAARGLVVLGFPSNDFGAQEPGAKQAIAATCFDIYGVKFPMFSKVRVVGSEAHPFFAALARLTGAPPRWNFHKYLIDRSGKVVASLPSEVAPLDGSLTQRIEQLLGQAAPGATQLPARPPSAG